MIEGAMSLYGKVTVETLNSALESPNLRYDKKGEEHYDTISAFIKSMRASQPMPLSTILRAWLRQGRTRSSSRGAWWCSRARMFGLAQPTALVVANAVFRACETIGYPDARLISRTASRILPGKGKPLRLQRAPRCAGRCARVRQSASAEEDSQCRYQTDEGLKLRRGIREIRYGLILTGKIEEKEVSKIVVGPTLIVRGPFSCRLRDSSRCPASGMAVELHRRPLGRARLVVARAVSVVGPPRTTYRARDHQIGCVFPKSSPKQWCPNQFIIP